MRTAVLTIRREPAYRRIAFESMLKKHGYHVITHYGGTAPRSREDILVLWNKKHGADEDNANRWERQGGTVLVVENGYLQRVDKTYYAISVHGHNGSGWFPVGGEDRFTKLGFELKPWIEWRSGDNRKQILVCGQRGIGSSLMASPPMWGERHCAALSTGGRHKPILRSHPGNFAPKVPLEQDLSRAYACHIWSSGAGVRALVEGVPVKHHAPYWICDRPEGRINQLHRMAHGQWHHEEIATGEPLARILDQLDTASWPPARA